MTHRVLSFVVPAFYINLTVPVVIATINALNNGEKGL